MISPNAGPAQPNLQTVSSFHLNELWLGPSITQKLSDRWSIGATLYGVTHSETTVGGSIQSGLAAGPASAELINSQMSAQGFTVILGAHFKASDAISFGLRAQSPFLQVHGSASVFDSTLTAGAGASGTPTSLNQTNLNGRYRLPADFTLGSAFKIGRSIQLLYDTSLQLPVNYQSIPAFSSSASYNTGATAGFGWQSTHIRTGVGMIGYWGNGHIRPSGAEEVLASGSVHAIGALLTTAYVF